MREYELPYKTLILWRIRSAAVVLLLLGGCMLLRFNTTLFLAVKGAVLAIFAIAFFWYLPKFFKSCKIAFVNDAVIIKRGVIINNTHILPFSRLIYTHTLTTPLARLLGLTAVSLKAARSRILVPEIKKTDAEILIASLSEVDKC